VKVLLDTNVLIAAFIAHGACHEILEHCIHHHELTTSTALLEEFRGVMREKFRFTPAEVREAMQLLRGQMKLIDPPPLEATVCRDPDDDRVLAAALAGAVSCIVTGDKDLLILEEYRGIRIVAPDGFWRLEQR
jgi:putative PIN family toxin of toxin-antitoxin system